MKQLIIEDLPAPTQPYSSAFGNDHEGFTEQWWEGRLFAGEERYSRHIVRRGSAVVARIELDWNTSLDHYAPSLDDRPLLEIEFIEVAEGERSAGLGRQIVELLISKHDGERLCALSEGADAFWDCLGWTRILHPSEPTSWRPLYLAS